ncbi:hypothetical protein CEXT_757481 [Caerostris extrusa]|uniref:Uncharacterized protein n=1 Tax=Caerostris extrusa TaxID=172846 RepID=A0AAV4TBE1_CAEEX|nr:hypothetical protein CEXT_757481 [Caerostris extrusa]
MHLMSLSVRPCSRKLRKTIWRGQDREEGNRDCTDIFYPLPPKSNINNAKKTQKNVPETNFYQAQQAPYERCKKERCADEDVSPPISVKLSLPLPMVKTQDILNT